MAIRLNDQRKRAFNAVLAEMASFRQVFGRHVSVDFIAELHVANELDLELPDGPNEPGADAWDDAGKRYQIKCRDPSTLNVDLNNFDFDYLVLINLDESYTVAGMWSLPVGEAKALFTHREKYRKHQVTQKRLKREANRIR